MQTFAQIATTDPQSRFDILVAAAGFVDAQLPGTNLIATLSDPTQSLTVFAPTDAAFVQLAVDQGFAGDTSDETAVTTFLTGLGPETLRDVILYHVSSGPQTAAQISAAGSVTPLSGPTITADLPTLVDAEPDLIDPSVIAADVMASNGILHVIDRVLLPIDLPGNDVPSVAGTVAASGTGFDSNSGDFDILLAAVTAANLGGALDDAGADLTVFAPTDAAFVGLAQGLGFAGTDEEGAWSYLVEALTLLGGGDPIPLLTEILTYHVAGESLQASQVLASAGITTLQGSTLTLNGTSIVDADPDIADPNLIQTDIQASNGVIHVIDGVLLPADVLASDGSNDVDFVIAGDRSDFISTGADADLIDGNGGSDYIDAGAGDDRAFGGDGADILLGRGGADLLAGGAGSDYVNGGDGADQLLGGAGHDFIVGGGGDDFIFGGAGNNFLSGGTGEDVFVLEATSGNDVILDFTAGEDFLLLEGTGDTDFAALQGQIEDFGFFGTQITLSTGAEIFLVGTHAEDLSARDFVFA